MNKAPYLLVAFVRDTSLLVSEVLQHFKEGDVFEASTHGTACFKTEHGVFFSDEVRVVNGLELVTYRHVNGDNNTRFRQYAKDPLPWWARDLQLDKGEA